MGESSNVKKFFFRPNTIAEVDPLVPNQAPVKPTKCISNELKPKSRSDRKASAVKENSKSRVFTGSTLKSFGAVNTKASRPWSSKTYPEKSVPLASPNVLGNTGFNKTGNMLFEHVGIGDATNRNATDSDVADGSSPSVPRDNATQGLNGSGPLYPKIFMTRESSSLTDVLLNPLPRILESELHSTGEEGHVEFPPPPLHQQAFGSPLSSTGTENERNPGNLPGKVDDAQKQHRLLLDSVTKPGFEEAERCRVHNKRTGEETKASGNAVAASNDDTIKLGHCKNAKVKTDVKNKVVATAVEGKPPEQRAYYMLCRVLHQAASAAMEHYQQQSLGPFLTTEHAGSATCSDYVKFLNEHVKSQFTYIYSKVQSRSYDSVESILVDVDEIHAHAELYSSRRSPGKWKIGKKGIRLVDWAKDFVGRVRTELDLRKEQVAAALTPPPTDRDEKMIQGELCSEKLRNARKDQAADKDLVVGVTLASESHGPPPPNVSNGTTVVDKSQDDEGRLEKKAMDGITNADAARAVTASPPGVLCRPIDPASVLPGVVDRDGVYQPSDRKNVTAGKRNNDEVNRTCTAERSDGDDLLTSIRVVRPKVAIPEEDEKGAATGARTSASPTVLGASNKPQKQGEGNPADTLNSSRSQLTEQPPSKRLATTFSAPPTRANRGSSPSNGEDNPAVKMVGQPQTQISDLPIQAHAAVQTDVQPPTPPPLLSKRLVLELFKEVMRRALEKKRQQIETALLKAIMDEAGGAIDEEIANLSER